MNNLLLLALFVVSIPQQEGDSSIRMTSPFLKYDIKNKTYFLETRNQKKPKLYQGKGFVEAETMWFSSTNEIGYAKNKVVFKDYERGIMLYGNYGEYNTSAKSVKVRGNALLILTKDNVKVRSYMMIFYRERRKAFFYGNVKIKGRNFSVKAKRAVYDSRKGLFKAYGDVETTTTNGTIKSDKVVVSFKRGKLKTYTATGNVVAVNSNETETVKAGYLYHNSQLKYTRLEKKPEIHLKNYNATIRAKWIDRLERDNISRAWGGVLVKQRNRILYGREVVLYHDEDKAVFVGNPAVKEDNNVFSSGIIEIFFNKNLVVMKGSGKGYYERK